MRKTERIEIRLTKEEKRTIIKGARRNKLSVGRFAIISILGMIQQVETTKQPTL